MKRLFFILITAPWLAYANVVGVDAQNFNPTTSGLDFVTVHSSKTLAPGVINFGLFFNYAINTLPNYEPVTTQNRTEPKDSLTSADINMGIGITNNWDVGISLPQVLSQSVDENSVVFHGEFEATGINEIRLNSKYRLWDGGNQGLAVIGSVNFFLIENYPYTGDSPGPTFNLEAAYDRTIQQWAFGANIGYRFRNQGDPILVPAGLPAPFGDQVIGSIAASYYFESLDFKLIGEIFGSYPTEDTEHSSDRDLASAELLIGAKWDFMYNLAGHFGFGTELFHGTSSPDLRVYAGINWALGPLFGDEEPPQSAYIETEIEEELTTNYYFIDGQGVFDGTPVAGSEKFRTKNVLFEFDGATVQPAFRKQLQDLATYALKGEVFKELKVIGHTDSVGSDTYNMKLSVKRAKAVMEVLKEYLPEEHHSKLSYDGRGEYEPIASNANYQGRALNRRVDFVVNR